MRSLEAETDPNRIAFIVDLDDGSKPYIHPPGVTLRGDKDVEVCFSIIQNGRELRLGCLRLSRDRRHDSSWLRNHVPTIRPEYVRGKHRDPTP